MSEVGLVFKSKNHGEFLITDRIGHRVTCEFLKTGYITTAQWCNAKRGMVMDRMMPKVYGVGYLGGVKFKSSTNKGNTKAYNAWRNMLGRCYDKKIQSKHKSYIGCIVCDEWHNFQNFAEWFYSNYRNGMEVNKDIIGNGKVYSPSTCIFITPQENSEYASAKRFSFVAPSGEVVNVYNLNKFCKDKDVCANKLSLVHSGKRNHHKGWTKNNTDSSKLRDGQNNGTGYTLITE